MANVNDLFPSRYLKAHELRGAEPVVTIARVELEAMGRSRDVLPVVYFVGKTKGLKLNVTMAKTVAALAGSPDTDAWAGTVLRLYATSATFGTDTFPVIRVKAATAPQLVNPAAPKVRTA